MSTKKAKQIKAANSASQSQAPSTGTQGAPDSDASSGGVTVIGGPPTLVFATRPAKEETMTDTLGLQPTYEQLRDSVDNTEARAAWNDADRRRALLTDTYRNLKDDVRYTEEHKANQMSEAYEKQSKHIQAAGEKARELLEREAKGHEMMAMPRPKGENIFSLSTEKLLAAQNEAARIVRTMERRQSASGPFKPNTANVLREEYARGIETGGTEGAAICKGALMAADELGISAKEFLNDLRTPEQLEALDKARRARTMAQSIGKRIPEPPLRRPVDSTPGPGKLFLPRNRPVQTKLPPHGCGASKRLALVR